MTEKLDLTKMRSFYEYDAGKSGRELAHGRLDIILKEIGKRLGDDVKKQRILDIGIADGYLIERIRDIGDKFHMVLI